VQNKMRTTEDEKMFAMEESLYRGPWRKLWCKCSTDFFSL
jgi:hypothetical protein